MINEDFFTADDALIMYSTLLYLLWEIFQSVNANGVRHVRRSDAAPQKLVGPAYRPTYAEKDREKRNKRARKKEEKKKAKEQEKMKSIWNLDNETCTDDNLDFRLVP